MIETMGLASVRSRLVRPLRPVAVGVSQRFVPKNSVVVLMYHRIADLAFDPWRIAVSPERFEAQIELLQKYFDVIALADLADAVERGKVPSRTLVITFDDGYRDVLHTAKPVLVKHGLPATVFVASGYVGSGRNFWWDTLERLSFASGRPREGTVEVDGVTGSWEAGDVELYHSLWEQLFTLSDGSRRAALEGLSESAGVDPDEGAQTMTEDELRELGEGGLVEIGGHTITHPNLAVLSTDAQLEEMRGSRTQLEAISGKPVKSFCFPHGKYTSESIALLPQAGYEQGCVSVRAVVQPGADRFELPRWQAINLYSDMFVWKLAEFFRKGR
jgi:peptidoglycan/xylan/chitin deacetylase (PgdA/CDA1 family)